MWIAILGWLTASLLICLEARLLNLMIASKATTGKT